MSLLPTGDGAPPWHSPAHSDGLCAIPPAPKLRRRLERELRELRGSAGNLVGARLQLRERSRVGLNDGLNVPGSALPLGTSARAARRAALRRAPLRGTVRVIVVLVDFADRPMRAGTQRRLAELFFSTGQVQHGSVREYFDDVSRGAVRIDGEVVGPFRMPRPITDYAGAENGIQLTQPNARTLADDALTAVAASTDPAVDFRPYDNDGNGFVDAYVVVHAGRGAEETGAPGDIWSHKWVLPQERDVDGTSVFGYLTIPEDAKLGVCAHELGHLVFGWPDLYDDDSSSRGIGDFCLMAGGSWGLGGKRPVHPSAWCKASQGWVPVKQLTANRSVTVRDVKDRGSIYRLWRNGADGSEYFLVENRQKDGYDQSMPAQGLFVWHIDDAVDGNSDQWHYQVALEQADGRKDLENNRNDGDAGDTFPGSARVTTFDDSSTPNSRSYGDLHTCVALEQIPTNNLSMKVRMRVRCTGPHRHG